MTSTKGKIHITDKGPRKCKAEKRACKYAVAGEPHFTEPLAAEIYFVRKELAKNFSKAPDPFGTMRKTSYSKEGSLRESADAVAAAESKKYIMTSNADNAERKLEGNSMGAETREQYTQYAKECRDGAAKAEQEMLAAKKIYKERKARDDAASVVTEQEGPSCKITLYEGPSMNDQDKPDFNMYVHEERGKRFIAPLYPELDDSRGRKSGLYSVATTAYGSLPPEQAREVASELRQAAHTAEVIAGAFNGYDRPEGTPFYDKEKLKDVAKVFSPSARKKLEAVGTPVEIKEERGSSLREYREQVTVGDRTFDVSATAVSSNDGKESIVYHVADYGERGNTWDSSTDPEDRERIKQKHRYDAEIFVGSTYGNPNILPKLEVQTTSYGTLDPEHTRMVADKLDQACDEAEGLNDYLATFTKNAKQSFAK